MTAGRATLFIVFLACSSALSQDTPALKLTKVIPLPNVAGRIDHMDIDSNTGRVFVAALGNNTVEVVGLREGRVLRTLKGFHEPQGVLYLADLHRLYVTNGGDGTCAILDGKTLERVKSLPDLEDADNIRYSNPEKMVYVGFGNGGLAAIDPAKEETIHRMTLPAHPESFQVESAGTRIFVNVPGDRKIVVIDRASRKAVAAWSLNGTESNFPMAFDENGHRVFVGCRSPARLLVFDALTGRAVATLPIGGDVDDVFFDAGRHRLYVSCGEGILDVISQQDAETYKKISRVVTRRGARTSLFIPRSDLLLVAVPGSGDAGAEIRVYSIPGH